jgi:hypothetical protein
MHRGQATDQTRKSKPPAPGAAWIENASENPLELDVGGKYDPHENWAGSMRQMRTAASGNGG